MNKEFIYIMWNWCADDFCGMSVNVEETPIYPLLEDSPEGLRVSDILPDNVTCCEHTECLIHEEDNCSNVSGN